MFIFSIKITDVSTLINRYDSIEALIIGEGLRIEKADIHPELDMMLIILNTKAVLQQRLSSYERFKTSNSEALLCYELIGGGGRHTLAHA